MFEALFTGLISVASLPNGTVCRVTESYDVVCVLPDKREYYCFAKIQECVQLKVKKETI